MTDTQTTPANDMADLNDPVQARLYVKEWAPRLLGKGKTAAYVQTSGDRLIHFKTMSDEDAIWVARQLKRMEDDAR